MSADDVYPYEMNESHDFDDTEAEILLSGAGQDVDPRLADLLGDLRVAYTSTPLAAAAELSALMGRTLQPAPVPSRLSRWLERARSSMLARIGAATAAVLAATGGLAVAHALPAPVQDAVSHLGIGTSRHTVEKPAERKPSTTVHPAVSTKPAHTPPKNTGAGNRDGAISGIAHDPNSDGCPGVELGSCETPTTIDGASPTAVDTHDETPTTVATNPGDANPVDTAPVETTPVDNQPSDVNETSPTTVADETTPTSAPPSDASDPSASKIGDSAPSPADGGDASPS